MTEATTGLRKALARAGNGSLVTLSELTTDDLLANLSDEQKAGVTAKLAPLLPAAETKDMPKDEDPEAEAEDEDPEAEADDDAKAGKDKKDGYMAAGVRDERVKAVAAAVASDAACQGKSDLALQMLADDDYASLSASGLVKLLAKTGGGAAATEADGETQALAEMRAALKEQRNSNIDALGGGSSKAAGTGGGAKVWDTVLARMNPKG